MPTTATRSGTTTRLNSIIELDLAAFAGSVREFSREVGRVGRAPLPSKEDAKLLVRAFDELERKLRALRARLGAIPGGALRTASDRVAAKPASGAQRLMNLDTSEAMVAKGQLVDPVKFQKLKGWKTRQAVWKAATDNRVFYLVHQAERYFPTFYADPSYQPSHLEAITKILGDLPGGSKLQFFLTRKGSLGGRTPLEALAVGDIAKVKSVASAFAEISIKA